MTAPARHPADEAHPDMLLMAVTVALVSIGLLMVASASITIADRDHGAPFHFLVRQAFAVMLGLGAALFMFRVPVRLWQQLGPWLALLALLLLVLVLVPGLGNTVNGSTRWLAFGGLRVVQVSEPVRLLLTLYVADYAVRHNAALRQSFVAFLRPLAVIAVACVLLIAQPDFGSAVVLATISLAVLFLAGARLRDVAVLLVPIVTAFALVAWLSPYRLRRLTGFIDPWADPFGAGFQLTQSLIAIGTGEWTGVGLGGSVQKLFYLPEAHTDFIFAVIAEEFGLVGSVVMIGLYALLVWRVLHIARESIAGERWFAGFVASGLAVWLALQALINIGVNLGILPTKGLTLPLVSYGRSSMIVTLAALGLLLRIDSENRIGPRRRAGGGR